MKFRLTREHFEKGHRGRAYSCPVAICIGEKTRSTVRVEGDIRFGGFKYKIPVKIVLFINDYDQGFITKDNFEEFEFELLDSIMEPI